MPTIPITAARPVGSAYAPARKSRVVLRTILGLLAVGLLLEILFLALYPLLAGAPATGTVLFFWPWSGLSFSWWLARISGLQGETVAGNAHLQLVLLLLASGGALLAALMGSRMMREKQGRLTRGEELTLFWFTMLLTALFSITLLCAPLKVGVMTRDMLLYGLYGRMVVVYHVNPYLVSPLIFHDMVQMLVGARNAPAVLCGPVWLDVCLLVALFAQNNIVHMLFAFRLIGLVAHLLNVVLLWLILGKWKPEMRITAVLLYAWSPLVLLFGIAMMHLEIVLVCLLLLALLFFLRNSPLLSWIFVLLVVLINPSCLLLLPLFLRMMAHHARTLFTGSRLPWWSGILGLSGLVIALAYAPYWQGWGISGLTAGLGQLFWQSNAVNSLDAAFLNLPLRLPGFIAWMVAPPHWLLWVSTIVAIFLLFSFWLVNTVEYMLLCGSWLFLLSILFWPVCWPWYILLAFALAVCSTNRATILLAMLLSPGGLVCYYCWLWPSVWMGLALITIGVPLLVWGWMHLFRATWQMARANAQCEEQTRPSSKRLSRPPWLSRPSWPSRPPWFSRPSWPSRPGRR